MSQTIISLWNGNLSPSEFCGKHDMEAEYLLQLRERNAHKLIAELTVEQHNTFQKFADCCDEYCMRMLELAFCEGFKLGTRLAVESLR